MEKNYCYYPEEEEVYDKVSLYLGNIRDELRYHGKFAHSFIGGKMVASMNKRLHIIKLFSPDKEIKNSVEDILRQEGFK